MPYRVICIFVKQKLYLARPGKTSSESMWSFRTADSKAASIKAEIKKRLGVGVGFEMKGVASTHVCYLPNSGRNITCIYLVINVQCNIEEKLGGNGWRWLMFSQITKFVSESKMSSDLLKPLTAVETDKLSEISEEEYEEEAVERLLGRQLDDCLDNAQTALKLQAGFGRIESTLLFETFLEYCWPSDVMGRTEFAEFFARAKIKHGKDLKALFRSFDYRNKGYLTFSDWLIGVAAMQPSTSHGSVAGDQRARYIFRYYSKSNAKPRLLAKKELGCLAADVHKFVEKQSGSKKQGEKAAENIRNLYTDEFSLSTFVNLVGKLKLRGTSHLFRLLESTIEVIKNNASRVPGKTKDQVVQVDLNPPEMPSCSKRPRLENKADSGSKGYLVAHHSLSISKSGLVYDYLKDVEDGVSSSAQIRLEQCPNSQMNQDVTNTRNNAIDIMRGLDFFAVSYAMGDKKVPKGALSWENVKLKGVALCFTELCEGVKQLLHNEPRCLKLKSPLYVMGDIHGNFNDLLRFEQRLWPLGAQFTAAGLLFLGDYVDRQEFGFEVVAYLFAQKVLYPDRVFLVRGNHELMHIQRCFDFKRECQQKFGHFYGRQVWLKANECFAEMPLAAVIDDSIFCAHGGLPHPSNLPTDLVASIDDLPTPLPEPAPLTLAWDLLWNDPLWPEGTDTKLDEHGFGPNEGRGNARTFSEAALESFLDKNSFSHMIRAHQVKNAGFHLQYSARLLTVFSSSSYCDLDNGAASVLVAGQKIRVVRFANVIHKEKTKEEENPKE